MKTQANNSNKNTSFKISDQVKRILQKNGLSKFFNFRDYEHFKEQAKTKGNQNLAQRIADFFIEEHQHESDFNEYIF